MSELIKDVPAEYGIGPEALRKRLACLSLPRGRFRLSPAAAGFGKTVRTPK
jgi:hypothetical protein